MNGNYMPILTISEAIKIEFLESNYTEKFIEVVS